MSNNKTPHKHAELIKKWADNQSLKFRYKYGNSNFADVSGSPSWDVNCEYEIKPEVIMYRVALFKELESYWTNAVNYADNAVNIESNQYFIKWITDWIEVEI